MGYDYYDNCGNEVSCFNMKCCYVYILGLNLRF